MEHKQSLPDSHSLILKHSPTNHLNMQHYQIPPIEALEMILVDVNPHVDPFMEPLSVRVEAHPQTNVPTKLPVFPGT